MMGNSHTSANGLPNMVAALVRAAWPGRTVEAVEAPTWMFLQQRASDPASLALLRSTPWRFVVLQAQEYSSSGLFDYPIDGAVALVRESRAVGALPILFPEWPRAEIPETQRIYDLHLSIARVAPACVPPIPQAWDLARVRLPDIELHAPDGNHARAPGSLLAAMVITATMTGVSPGLFPAIEGVGVDAGVQARLRSVAAETVTVYAPRTGCPGDAVGP
ncbi:hypothetical protein DSM104443_03069 [Usitatibacter rugosus]|uniref:Uncharacterized protein n=2 Tax=Usitatibacter rugosus TaxID=2732067 RepID=A0A6M4GXK5_9PROT|nr:hypothetical protein DSM104443_03069 [Usitatibacter rugosus]